MNNYRRLDHLLIGNLKMIKRYPVILTITVSLLGMHLFLLSIRVGEYIGDIIWG